MYTPAYDSPVSQSGFVAYSGKAAYHARSVASESAAVPVSLWCVPAGESE